MPVPKSRAPEYPRPVSPVCADEVPICNDTVIYYDQVDKFEATEKQRAAKRRRIEANATSYLRGQPLTILTADLKGPFDDGWWNPWAKRSTSRDTSGATARQAHLQQLLSPSSQAARSMPSSTKVVKRWPNADTGIDMHSTDERQRHLENKVAPGLSPEQNEKTVKISVPGHRIQNKDRKVENWLRTSDTYEISEHSRPDASPPSPSKGKKKTPMSSPHKASLPVEEDTVITVTGDNTSRRVLSVKPVKGLTRSFSSPVQDRAFPHDDEVRDFLSSPVRSKPHRTPLQKRDSNALLPSTVESRAEYAILKSRRDILQTNTAEADSGLPVLVPDAQADVSEPPQPGLRLLSHEFQEPRDVNSMADDQSYSNGASASLRTAHEGLLSNPEELGPSLVEKHTTHSGMTPDLPSAQVPEIPIAPSLASIISSHDQMLHDSPRQEIMSPVLASNLEKTSTADVPRGEAADPDQLGTPEKVLQLQTKPEGEYESHRGPPQQQDTENIVASKKAQKAATAKFSATRNSVDSVTKGASPLGVKRTKGLKTRKRQAFGSDEKQPASIKSTLNVAKPMAKILETTMPPKPSLGRVGDHQALEIDSHNSIPAFGSPTTSRASLPKSILRPAPQHSLGASTSHINSSSTKPDAQRQRMLNLVDHDEEFDLDGAIDDLGSFLDTWDAEKQAAGVL